MTPVKLHQCSVKRLRRRNLPVNTIELARYLIGKTLVHDLPAGRLSGRIVETEGYPPGDAAGRAFRGKKRGNQSLFLGRGCCHVYFIYGSSFMVNVTSEDLGIGAGVLRDFGNMSSPTALFALDRAVKAGASGPHLLVAFGPGFSAYFAAVDL